MVCSAPVRQTDLRSMSAIPPRNSISSRHDISSEVSSVAWEVLYTDEFGEWFETLAEDQQDAV
ncbi:MAG: hypothetical protein ACRDTT_21535, partial [Pseudonocardiaceae bacterium]